jgi:hypothetical protein
MQELTVNLTGKGCNELSALAQRRKDERVGVSGFGGREKRLIFDIPEGEKCGIGRKQWKYGRKQGNGGSHS